MSRVDKCCVPQIMAGQAAAYELDIDTVIMEAHAKTKYDSISV